MKRNPGKIEENEDPFDCAVREVKEETSFDIKNYATKSNYLEKVRYCMIYSISCHLSYTLQYSTAYNICAVQPRAINLLHFSSNISAESTLSTDYYRTNSS